MLKLMGKKTYTILHSKFVFVKTFGLEIETKVKTAIGKLNLKFYNFLYRVIISSSEDRVTVEDNR